MPDPLPRPPRRPPGEPIIIRNPPRPPEAPEIDGSLDEEDDPEIGKLPEIGPEMPLPPPPEERPHWALLCAWDRRRPPRRAGRRSIGRREVEGPLTQRAPLA